MFRTASVARDFLHRSLAGWGGNKQIASMYGDELNYDEDEAFEFLRRLMPQGFAGADVMDELAPEGWAQSGLVRAYHPTVEQAHAEAVAMHENLQRLRQLSRKRRGESEGAEDPPAEPPPTLGEIRAEFEKRPVKAEEECRDLVGCVLWEIFSDNHSVIADDGREIDLGSFRGTSSTLDAFDRARIEEEPRMEDWMDVWGRGDHMRFYCGLAFIAGRTDYRPVYEMVFRRLKALGADWIYRFPRLGVVRFDQPDEPDRMENYSPSEAFAQEAEKREKDAEFARMEAEMEAAYQESAEAATKADPPPIVQAYRRVYGRLPSGWPPG